MPERRSSAELCCSGCNKKPRTEPRQRRRHTGHHRAAVCSSVRLGCALTDLDQRFTRREQRLDVRPRVAENPTEKRIARIPAREPNDLRRRTPSRDEIHKVAVLREHDRAFGACPREDGRIFGAAETEVADRDSIDPDVVAQPLGERGGQLRIDPDPHRLRREDGVSHATTGKAQARRDIVAL